MILDTNILIAYLQPEHNVISTLQNWARHGRSLSISSITRAELLSWPKLTTSDRVTAARFLLQFFSVPFDDRLADLASDLRRKHPKLELPDAAIAATALAHDDFLVTRDSGFDRIHELKLIKI